MRTPARAWHAFDRSSLTQQRLYFGRQVSPRKSLLRRIALVVGLVTAVIVVFALDRDGLQDANDGHVSFADVIYFAFITITTVGYGDIVPVSTGARLIDAFFVTPIRLFVWAIFLGTAYQFVARRLIEDIRMRLKQTSLTDHVVVCGIGLSGRSAVSELVRRGCDPAGIVAIDLSEAALLEAADAGVIGLRGDATREAILGDARIEAARTAIVCLGRDDTTVLCTLTLRSLAPRLRIVAIVKEAENERLAIQGGASATICPSTLSGTLMASSIDSSRIAGYVSDLLTAEGRVMLAERTATDQDVGRRPAELADGIALRIHRGDAVIGFWEAGAMVAAGDRLIVLAPRIAPVAAGSGR
jgi:voltage-gated potassium channel